MAATISVSTEAALDSAFNAVLTVNKAADGDVIQLTSDITINNSLILKDGRTLTLDLNEHTLSGEFGVDVTKGGKKGYTYQGLIALVHGHLNIVGNGEVINTHQPASAQYGSCIIMFGTGYKNSDKSRMTSAEYIDWSNLVIGDGVHETKITHNGLGSAAIEVYMFGKRGTITPKTTDQTIFLYDICNDNINGWQTYTWSDDVNKTGALDISAYGVNILVKSKAKVYGRKYGIQIGGNINARNQDGDVAKVPTITIENGAEVSAHETESKSTGIYAAGVGVWNVGGDIHGSTGIFVKAGEVNITDGAEIYSDNDTYREPGSTKSGVNAGGSAIVYQNNDGYGGHMSLNITGDAVISGNGGYAFEANTPTDHSNHTDNINIQGGEFNSGDKGCFDAAPIIAAIDDGAQIQISVDGTTFDNKTETGGVIDLLVAAAADGYIIAQTTDPKTGEPDYVIVPAPVAPTVDGDINQTGGTAYVTWTGNHTEALAIDEADIAYLGMEDNSHLTIPTGKTLKANSIVMTMNTVITVEAGGRLIVGDGGFVANRTTNLELKAQEGNNSIYLLSPAAVANKTPSASVELTTKAYRDGSTYVYQRIGVPAANGIKVSEIGINPTSAGIALAYWGGTEQDWVWVPNTSYLLQPFQGLALTNAATAPGTKYTFPCRIMGNTNGNLPLVGAWTSFANSYMADVDLYTMLGDVLAAASGASASVYVYDAPSNWWKTISYADLQDWKNGDPAPEYTKLEPIQGFLFSNIDPDFNANAEINYANAVWAPVMTPSPAPARRSTSVNNTTRVKITVTAENGQYDYITLRQGDDFTAEFDNGYDAIANIGINPINIYATTELGDLASVADKNIDGVKLSINTKEETSFKMTFSNINGDQLAIRDNLTGSVIDITEGAEYFFSVAENSVNNRFEIIAAHKAPTALDEVGAAHGAKGVYTVLGQYIGSTADFNALPAGIYVVDGVKMVK